MRGPFAGLKGLAWGGLANFADHPDSGAVSRDAKATHVPGELCKSTENLL